MNILTAINRFDKNNYLDFLVHFPEQIQFAFDLDIPEEITANREIHNVVIAGMGGSAIGGELLQSLYSHELTIPVNVVREYNLPGFVNSKTLILLSSYSGNTEETLSAYKKADKTGGAIVCITTGGKLAERARKDGHPIIFLPEGYQPRAAIGLSFIPLIRIFHKIGFLNDKSGDIKETVKLIGELSRKYSPENGELSEPLHLAQKIFGKIPIIYTGPSPFEALGTRWKCQFNENAKVLAFNNRIPELNHNEIIGWDKEFAQLEDLFVIFLRDKNEEQPINRRIEITKELIAKLTNEYTDITSIGTSILARAFSLLYYGDFTSFYLAILNKKDPSEIDNIIYLKNKLQQPSSP